MKISIGCPPAPYTKDFAINAEELGYHRIWLFDSPPVYEDIYIHLAQVAEATTRIGLGTAVLVPSMRHPMTTATAIATVDRLAPGRLVCGWGTGNTAQRVMGQKALTWKYTRTYIEQVRALLRGEVVEIDGAPCKMLHHAAQAKERPIEVPMIISAFGPKGVQITREIGDGWMGGTVPPEPFDVAVTTFASAVLEADESHVSDRIVNSAGVWGVNMYHFMWETDRERLGSLPGGHVFIDAMNELPEDQRHFALHYGHDTHLNDIDRRMLAAVGENMVWEPAAMIGTADQVRAKLISLRDAGITEIIFLTGGDDRIGEARKFMEAVRDLQE